MSFRWRDFIIGSLCFFSMDIPKGMSGLGCFSVMSTYFLRETGGCHEDFQGIN